MYLVVTDCGAFWNHKNPLLKKYKESVIVVCLNGKKVTDEYKCFVVPYYGETMSEMFGEVPSVSKWDSYRIMGEHSTELAEEFGVHEDIVFLADHNVESFFPLMSVLAKTLSNKYNRFHLCAMPLMSYGLFSLYRLPCFEEISKKLYSVLNADIESLRSFYGDRNIPKNQYDSLMEMSEKMIPSILIGIHEMKKKSFFDYSSMKYVPLTDGFDSIDNNKHDFLNDVNFDITPRNSFMGRVAAPDYPSKSSYVFANTERIHPKADGKRVCSMLREHRIQLAQVNGIEFESEECPSIGPCAGTCAKCDREAAYLRDELEKIPENRRVYPEFDLNKEMRKWMVK